MKRKIFLSLVILLLASASIVGGILLAEMKKKSIQAEKLAQVKNEKIDEKIESKTLGENTQKPAPQDLKVVSEKNQENPGIKKETIQQPVKITTEVDYTDDLTPEEDPDDIIEDPEMEN